MNHGAIPVVHNSGGAKELAPHVLTFEGVAEARDKIEEALKEWSPEIAVRLRQESLRFSTDNFKAEFLGLLQKAALRRSKSRQSKHIYATDGI